VRLCAPLPGGRRRERGAVLVHVAVAMMGLLAFSAVSIDLGTLWVARGQAQNAADAAAHAGVVSLAYGNPADAPAAAQAVVSEHRIWGETVSPASVQTQIGPCPAGSPAIPGDCVRVAVERSSATGSPLPVFFSQLFGAGTTTLRASASAKVMFGNATSCLQPIAIPDRWVENGGTWTYTSIFQRYQPGMPGVLLADPDRYDPPSAGSPGSGYLVGESVGRRIVINRGHIDAPEVRADNFYSLDLPRPGGTVPGDDVQYDENMTSCTGLPVSIGDTVFTMGAHQTNTNAAIAAIIARDPAAAWDGTRVVDSAYAVSPRIIQMILYDPDQFSQVPTPVPELYRAPMVVRNIVGLFVEGMDGGQITGVVMTIPGTYDGRAQAITREASFMRSVALVR
jgi:hypothetical protein